MTDRRGVAVVLDQGANAARGQTGPRINGAAAGAVPDHAQRELVPSIVSLGSRVGALHGVPPASVEGRECEGRPVACEAPSVLAHSLPPVGRDWRGGISMKNGQKCAGGLV